MAIQICENISTGENGHLLFAGQDTVALAREYGTPLYLMDEDRIRQNCRIYLETFRKLFRTGSRPLYASKACSFKRIYGIMKEEGMGIDVVSPGEIHTAKAGGFDLADAYFHGNNKTDEDVAYAMDCGVGYFVADNPEELEAIDREAAKRGFCQKVLLRLTPGIDPHTYAEVSTGQVDSKFGMAIETGSASEFVRLALSKKHIELKGYHCHLGSQVFAEDVFERAAEAMTGFAAKVMKEFGYVGEQIDIGGGFGTRYVDSDPQLDIRTKLESIAASLRNACAEHGYPEPVFLMEPGRSIVADAGMTLYTAGSVKHIPGYKTYVSVDGGMTDNPRFALYRSKYTCLAAGRMNEPCEMKCDLVGRCCESGDIIQKEIQLPYTVSRGDIIAVCTTGAYNHAMSMNYNKIPKPPVIMLSKGGSYIAVKRESYEDLCRNDL